MELRFEASPGAVCTPPAEDLPPPAISLSGARWTENAVSWTLTLNGSPQEAARLVRFAGLSADEDAPFRFRPARACERGELTVTISGSGADWEEFDEHAAKRQRRAPARFPAVSVMHLEWPLLHAAAANLKPGEFEVGDCLLRILPDSHRIEVLAPLDAEAVSAMTMSGYTLHPADDWKEQVVWQDAVMGVLLKPEQLTEEPGQLPAPFLLLHGLENSLGHPVLMKPFPATLQAVDVGELERIVLDTLASVNEETEPAVFEGGDAGLDADELQAMFQVEYAGVDPDDMPVLLNVVFGLTEGLAETTFGDAETVGEDWMGSCASALIGSLLCGSRVMRAELARRGLDASLARRLGERESMSLAYGTMYAADALRRAVGDTRSGRVWSLPLTAAMRAERLLAQALGDMVEDEQLLGEELLVDAFLCFDLGVRYQLARVAPELLVPVREDDLDDEDDDEVG